MYNATLYSKSNDVTKNITSFMLNKYSALIQLKKNILDIGCGEGSTLKEVIVPMLPLNISVTGLDQSEEMIRAAKELFKKDKNFDFVHANIANPKLTEKLSNRFDNIVSFLALHFVEDQENTFRNIYELLRPTGKIFLVRLLMEAVPTLPDSLQSNYCNLYNNCIFDDETIITTTNKFVEKFGFVNVKSVVETYKYEFKSYDEFFGLIIAVNPYLKNLDNESRGPHIQRYLSDLFSTDMVQFKYDKNIHSVTIVFNFKTLLIAASK